MNAPAHAAHLAAPGAAALAAPFCDMSDAALLAHMRARTEVSYFAVPDAAETRPEKIEAIMRGAFEFNGECFTFDGEPAWLANPSADVEWHILLHKFYYAVGLGMAWSRTRDARYCARWIELVEGWMAVTPPGFIAADVTGRRVQNWIYACHYFVSGSDAPVDAAFFRRMLLSIHEQVEYLCANLHEARNHRTLELYAIFLAGVVFPEFARAQAWRGFALAEIVSNMRTDLLPDGVQCELSTDYHHLVLKNYLCVRRLAAINRIAVPAEMDAGLARALAFSLFAHKPDGIVPSLSDGDARGFLDLLAQGAVLLDRDDMDYVASRGAHGAPPAARSAWFGASGYAIVRSHWGEAGALDTNAHYLIFDCGPLGAGNHGHFDCLSVELAAHGRSLVVDPGRFTYSEAGDTNWRVHFRGTAAHNTVCVDGRNQTRYLPKAPKRAGAPLRHKVSGPAPEVHLQAFLSNEGGDFLQGTAHSAEYPVRHTRRILHVRGEYWVVVDTLAAEEAHDYDLRFQLGEAAQGAVARERLADGWRVTSPNLLILQPGTADCAVDAGWVSYRYGEKFAAPTLRFAQRGAAARFVTVLLPFAEEAPRASVAELVMVGDAEDSVSLRVEIGQGDARLVDHVVIAAAGDARTRELAGLRCRGTAVVREQRGAAQLRFCAGGAAGIDGVWQP